MGARLAKLFGKAKETRILLAGLDAAGKTTILYKLKLGEIVTTIPTIGFNVETIAWNNISFTAWDVGGRSKTRPLYRHYFANTEALVYVIDSNDIERLSEAKEELHSFLSEDELRDSLILIFANKQDLPNAKSPMAISEALDLHRLKRHWHIIPTVATTGEGLTEGLEWIAEMMEVKHLTTESKEIIQLKHKTKTDNYNISVYFKATWNFFHSLFVGSEEIQTA